MAPKNRLEIQRNLKKEYARQSLLIQPYLHIYCLPTDFLTGRTSVNINILEANSFIIMLLEVVIAVAKNMTMKSNQL